MAGLALATAAEQREAKRALERSLQATSDGLKACIADDRALQAKEVKEIDRLLSRRGMLQQKAEDFTASIRKLGAIPKDAIDSVHAGIASKALLTQIVECHQQISRLGNVRSARPNKPQNGSFFWLPVALARRPWRSAQAQTRLLAS